MAAQVIADDAVAGVDEGGGLRRPHAPVEGAAVDEDDGGAFAFLVVVGGYAVGEDGRHGSCL